MTQAAPVLTCPNCTTANPASAETCSRCGHDLIRSRRPAPPKRSIKPWLLAAALLAFTWWAAVEVGFTLALSSRQLDEAREFLRDFWPPDFAWAFADWNNLWGPMIETIQIAVLAALVGCLVALPIAFWASRLTAPNLPVYIIDKGFLNVIRTIPDIFWAMLFVASVGIGAFSGLLALTIFGFSIMGKLLSETVDAADPGPLEAAKASGAGHTQAVQASVLPQVLPNYVAYALYIFELCIRASVVIGLVGAGGIGRILDRERKFFHWDNISAIVVVIFGIVFLIEMVSVYVRRRLV
jgi:phosphonate transport system permease protein